MYLNEGSARKSSADSLKLEQPYNLHGPKKASVLISQSSSRLLGDVSFDPLLNHDGSHVNNLTHLPVMH